MIKRKIFCLLTVLLFLISCFPLAASATAAGASSTVATFQYQNVKKDLTSGTVEGGAFSVERYPYVAGADDGNGNPKMELIALYEYGYNDFEPTMGRYHDYSLFLYLYNPGNVQLQTQDKRFAVSMAFNDTDEYEKYSLTFCSVDGDGNGHDYLYYKFRVGISAEDLRKKVGSAEPRVYNLSELELVVNAGDLNATAFKVGGRYAYTGKMAAYGVGETTLSASVSELLTISLDVHSVVYRTDKNAANDGIKNQLNSVYFSIPNKVLDEYGALDAVHFSYYSYDSGWMVGFQKQEGYDDFKSLEGVTVSEYRNDLDTLYSKQPTGGMGSSTYYWWAYNFSGFVQNKAEVLTYVFQYDESVGFNQILDTGVEAHFGELWQQYNRGESSALIEAVFSGDKSEHYEDRILSNSNPEDQYIIGSFDGNWFERLFGLDSGYSQDQLAPIVEVERTHLNDVEGSLWVDAYYTSELQSAYDAATAAGETLHLFRFANSEYLSWEIQSDHTILNTHDGMTAKETIYMDFDIIDLTFVKNGQATVIPVAASPINIIGAIETPASSGGVFGDDTPEWLQILALVLIVIVLLLTAPLWVAILKPLIQLLWWLLKLPFKILAALFRWLKDRGHK